MTRSIRVHSLEVKRFRAIRNFSVPRDGLGWNQEIPDVMLVGGRNGSGKTSLLELIYQGLEAVVQFNYIHTPNVWRDRDSNIDASVTFNLAGTSCDRLLVRRSLMRVEPAEADQPSKCIADYTNVEERGHYAFSVQELVNELVEPAGPNPRTRIETGMLYIPSDRSLLLPPTQSKTPGKLEDHELFCWRWSMPQNWGQSVEALLYSARWADLNAKELGYEPTNFAAYQSAFGHFFGASKRLEWTRTGDLVVSTESGQQHDLSGLSSGEKQVLVLCAEISRRWRPGSLVLIDEPELHLHEQWQTALWTFLLKTQQERRGQLIVATQSDHLFRIARPGTKTVIESRSELLSSHA